jgi:hypothetical protein
MRQYKTNLSILNSRYGDLERRVLLYFIANPDYDMIDLAPDLDILLMYLFRDKLLERVPMPPSFMIGDGIITPKRRFRITVAGREFINHWLAAQPLDEAESRPE